MTGTKPKIYAPAHLKPPTKRRYRSVMHEYVLGEHHQRLLLLACEAFDRCAHAREMIDKLGIVLKTGTGSFKSNPALAVERDSRLAFARLLDQLGLDDIDAPTEPQTATRKWRS